MKIVVVGTGYVGLVSGTCFAEMGYHVTCVDVDAAKIESLKRGVIPIYEPGLDDLVMTNVKARRLEFSTDLVSVLNDAEVCFIAVGTPPGEDGSADLRHVLAVARDIGKHLVRPLVVVNKSTVPVGTAERVKDVIQSELDMRNADIEFNVASNPEFLKEGDAINDFMRPDRIIVGTNSEKARDVLERLYAPFNMSSRRVMHMGIREAELTKYAANAMLATKISFMNEIALLCDSMNVDVESVRQGIGADARIGYHFIFPGCGYGGSCFPKDVKALVRTAKDAGVSPLLLEAVENRNTRQKQRLFEKLTAHFDTLQGRSVAVWGLAFKPGTDDVREAPSIELIRSVIAAGGRVRAFDPAAGETIKQSLEPGWLHSGQVRICNEQYETLEGAEALVLVTEWKPFRSPDWARVAAGMKGRLVVDGRNQYRPDEVRSHGFTYTGIGRSGVRAQ